MKPDSTTAPAGATALTTKDADLLDAFERRAKAFSELLALKEDGPTTIADEERLWDEINMSEGAIAIWQAETPRGVEAQLWTALAHLVGEAEQDARTYRGDLAYFNAIKTDLDWPAKIVLAAINSLRALGGAA